MCDQRLVSASRARWLVMGSHLQKQGFLSVADDVFFYQRSELIQAMEEGIGIPREEVSRRRALQDQFRSTLPPLYLGLKPETLTSPDDIPAEGAAQQSVKGMAASPGVYRGRARVIQSLDQAGTLKNGDIPRRTCLDATLDSVLWHCRSYCHQLRRGDIPRGSGCQGIWDSCRGWDWQWHRYNQGWLYRYRRRHSRGSVYRTSIVRYGQAAFTPTKRAALRRFVGSPCSDDLMSDSHWPRNYQILTSSV